MMLLRLWSEVSGSKATKAAPDFRIASALMTAKRDFSKQKGIKISGSAPSFCKYFAKRDE
jgi:hypothetical protein